MIERQCQAKVRSRRFRSTLGLLWPLKCAKVGLAPGEFSFDLIVMDEASQLKPEDAVGALARGAQMVIV